MTTTHDTAATLEAAIDDYGNATAREAMNADERAALHSAITAHVEAEVARRLAAAPEVESAIETHGDTCYERGFRHAHKSEAVDSELDAAYDRLRAAIAADKARAVEAAHEGMRRVYADRMLVRDREAMEALAALDEERAARPTPDEAHRMINELIGATAIIGNGLDDDPGTVVAKRIAKDARTALLRALGVEA